MPPTNIRTLSSNNNSSPSSDTQKSFPATGGRTLRVSSSSTNEDNSTDRIGASSSSSTDVKKAPLNNNNNNIIIKRDDGMENIPREFTPQKFIPPPRFDTNKTRSNPSSSSNNMFVRRYVLVQKQVLVMERRIHVIHQFSINKQ
ncbi:predicted protein [Naegleria gruberi]|uniref:Predicted protein n=1 Tax=Naegleria gruberi TaxID=5762 RepID=D2W4Q6_NAEGR|nr:uncharacterized protein NAEGRDRAFT_76391 [Naegleria gruberi]EFC35944.1 predicted protein [Naegleria gruberi]|eukprot:XP_002668688.1 predicted protein [Naegleria gruberi strain NEG-M]